MSRYSDQIRDEYSRLVPGVSVYVYKWDAYAQVAGDLEILTDDSSAPLGNPLISDDDGLYYFNSLDGQKLLEYHYGGKVQERSLILVGALPVPQATFAGLFINAAALTIPVGMDLITTTGYSSLDVGAAVYTYDAAVNSAYVAANPRTAFIEVGGRGFRLSTEQDINVEMVGALGGGVNDDTAAIQASLDFIKAHGGGALCFLGADYKITAGLLYDISANATRFGSRLRIKGAGSARTNILLQGVASTALTMIGNPAVSETYLDIENIRISGDNTNGSRGIYLNVAAYGGLDRVVIEAFDQNVEFLNVEQISLSNSNIRWGHRGLKTDVGTSTAANSIILFNTVIANNTINGLDLSDLNLFTMIGGSIQYNGATGGGATNFGCKLTNPGTSYGPIKFQGVAFEGNGGQADLWVNSPTNAAAVAVDSCAFSRADAVNYATNNLLVDGTQSTTVKLSTTVFRSFNAYVPNAGRPYIAVSNTAAIVQSDGTNVFGSATEAPTWYATPYPVMLNGGVVYIGGGLVGYGTGVGGTVTQATSKSTGVTLNKACGQITMNNAALASAAKVSFVVTNSAVAATDTVIANVASGGTANAYRVAVTAIAAGSFTITAENITGGSLSEAPVVGFAVLKSVTA